MSKRIIVANWKMNPQTREEAARLSGRIEYGLVGPIASEKVDVVICPPFVFLPALRHTIHFAKLGAQDVSGEELGAFTGQISASQLYEFGCRFVIVGHSERRVLGEDDTMINKKIRQALKYELEPILCVGYGVKKRSSLAQIKRIVEIQLKDGLKGINLRCNKVAVAYEPVWAIGTGKPVTPVHAATVISYLKSKVKSIRGLYGGSVDSVVCNGFAAQKAIDGVLVGGASLDAKKLLLIINSFNH